MRSDALRTFEGPRTGRQPPERERRRHGALVTLERIVLGALTAVISINLWTGCPVLALWIGSRFAFDNPVSMGAIVVVIVTLSVFMFLGLYVLGWISARHDRITGRPATARQPAPWLRSLRGERRSVEERRGSGNSIETIVIWAVVVAVIAIEVWFFFFAKAALPR